LAAGGGGAAGPRDDAVQLLPLLLVHDRLLLRLAPALVEAAVGHLQLALLLGEPVQLGAQPG